MIGRDYGHIPDEILDRWTQHATRRIELYTKYNDGPTAQKMLDYWSESLQGMLDEASFRSA